MREPRRFAGRRREQDLPAVASRAHPGGGVDGDTHVAGLGERRATGVDADAHADLDAVRPLALRQRPLDAERGVQRAGGFAEDGEELVRPGVDLVPVRAPDAGADERTHVAQQRRISVAELPEQPSGTMPYFLAAFSSRWRERSRAASSSKAV